MHILATLRRPPRPAARRLTGALLLAALTGAAPLAALEGDDEQPLYIEADAAELDEKQSISLYIGNVEVRQGSMHIYADEALVQHKPNRKPQKIIAIGQPARYRQLFDDDPDEVHGRALRMEYETDRDEITLIDEAELTQGADRFASDRIVYNRTTGRVVAGTSAQGSERVRIRIEPDQE
ncbi:lipopolysaccharide transport periplasmic protein LptA [Thiohalocapsa marina]|uniref:Lipopolysaccharide export system protein LptA n=2 Tax=Thiohalocapsa marina TaxID=424902 RepID=A0A5M8FMZ9_9GAMM|nr:lipopolysaccharide transport periplasmic protein LptA [Thiohalocapsa marina]